MRKQSILHHHSMKDYASPRSYMDGERCSSPKRKKIRQKYAPKACISCRRSKLKASSPATPCTGENPCQRCVDNGKRCFYSEDQTAAEALQNLSRRAPTPASQHANTTSNSHSMSQQHLVPPHHIPDRRASDASNMMPTMEERMTRVERMLEALMQERGLGFTPSGSIEREQSIGFRSETAFSLPILDPIHPALDQMAQQPLDHLRDSLLPETPLMGADATALVRAGNREVPFPDPARYQQYVAQFFGDLHLRHPCVDEADFTARVQQLVTNGATEPSEYHFLALCYSIFACCDASLTQSIGTANNNDKAPGWQWYELADTMVDKTTLVCRQADDASIQHLFFQALYLAYADAPALAYAAMRTAFTVALQNNLHQQAEWLVHVDTERAYWRASLFWNIWLLDSTISISCGRPVSLHAEDINIEAPQVFYNRIHLNAMPADVDQKQAACLYLEYEIQSAKLALDILRRLTCIGGNVAHARECILQYCNDGIVPAFDSSAKVDHMSYPALQTFSALRRLTALLMIQRRTMTVADPDLDLTSRLVSLVSDALQKFLDGQNNPAFPPSCRHQLASAAAGILSICGPLLLRNDMSTNKRQPSGYHHEACINDFMKTADVLSALSMDLPYGKRVYEDCKDIIIIVTQMAEKWRVLSSTQKVAQDWDSFAAEFQLTVATTRFPYQDTSPCLLGPGAWGDSGSKSGVLWWF
ncbi:hypothetical protein ACEQ8H_003504 [Pleosporales sp. CAS-2024a]